MNKQIFLGLLVGICVFTQTSCSDNPSTGTAASGQSAGATTETNKDGVASMKTDEAPAADTVSTSGEQTSSTADNSRLVKVEVAIDFTGDGVNKGTKFETLVYRTNRNHAIASFDQMDGIGDDARWTQTLVLKDNTIPKDSLKFTKLHLALVTTSNDKAWGNPLATFTYSDGTIKSYKYRPFKIGTHDGWSHQTDQDVFEW
jgi:hypothetical protein